MLSPDILVSLWEKFVGLVPISSVNALTRMPMGKYRGDPDTWSLVRQSCGRPSRSAAQKASIWRATPSTGVSQ